MQVIKAGLERLLGEERFKKVQASKAYRFSIDSASMSAFWLPVTITNEVIAGMTPIQIFYSRCVGTAMNIMIGPPFAAVRGQVYRGLGMSEDSHWAPKYVVDTVMQAPILSLYYGIMRMAGADHDTAVKGVIQVTPLCAALGRPQGWFMDQARYHAALPTSYEKKSLESTGESPHKD